MDDFTLPPELAAYATHTYDAAGAVKTTQAAQTGDTSADFKSLLTLMLLSSMNLGGSASAESGGMPGMNMSQLMAPLMLTLLEKLIAGQVDDTAATTSAEAPVEQSVPQGLPLQGKGRLTQGSHAGHVALDFGVPVGTPVHATMDGKVVYAGWNNEGYGNLVIVEKGEYRTYFAHLSKIPVRVGDRVQAGTVIGMSGNTGNSTGPHLHYEIRRNGTAIDPTRFTKA